jgi:hypothetical protein
MSTMFESNDWSPQLKKAAENFVKLLSQKDSTLGAVLKKDIKQLEELIYLAYQEGYNAGESGWEQIDPPDKEEES